MNEIDKKNLLILANAFWNNGQGISGGDQVIVQIFKRIRRHFNDVICRTNRDGKKIIAREINSIDFSLSCRFFDKLPLAGNYLLRTIGAISCLKLKNTDILFVSSDFFPDVLPAFFFKLFHEKMRWCQMVHHVYPDWKNRPGKRTKNFLAQYLQKFSFWMIKRANIIINVNSQVKETLVEYGLDESRIIIINNGIDAGYLENLKTVTGIKKYNATFLGRLNPSKGIFDLVEIWKKVISSGKDLKLAIIGGGSDEIKSQLQLIIHKYNLDSNIDVLGFIDNEHCLSIIKNSQVFLFPSHEEGFGIAIAEAMACSIPVVAWNLPVYNEIYEDNLIKVEENNFDAFAKKTLEILNNVELGAEIARKAKKFIIQYDWNIVSAKYLELLTSGDHYDKKSTKI